MIRNCRVEISRFAEKQLTRIPYSIQEALAVWKDLIENEGISAMRNIPGYRDKPLRGNRRGQRSSRLNRSYRVIYEGVLSGSLIVIGILEVSKHEY